VQRVNSVFLHDGLVGDGRPELGAPPNNLSFLSIIFEPSEVSPRLEKIIIFLTSIFSVHGCVLAGHKNKTKTIMIHKILMPTMRAVLLLHFNLTKQCGYFIQYM